MPLTQFPYGVSSFGFPLIGSGPVISTGTVWFVNSATGIDAPGRGTDPSRPFKTLAFAVTQAGAGRADVIFLMPGHAETITAAASVNLSVAGVSVVGLGQGTGRPTISFTTIATASLDVSAANCSIQNVVFDCSGVASLANAIRVLAGGAGFTLAGCKIIQANATNQCLNFISIADADVTIQNNDVAALTAGAATWISVTAASARLKVIGNWVRGNFSTAIISAASTFHATDMLIQGNSLYQANGTAKVVVAFTTSSTGLVRDNMFIGTTWASAADAIGSNSSNVALRWTQNFGFDDGAGIVSGVLVPAAGTIS